MPDFLKKLGNAVFGRFRKEDSVEKITEDFLEIRNPNKKDIDESEKRVKKLKPVATDGFIMLAGFEFYIKTKNDRSKMSFRDVIMAVQTIYNINLIIEKKFENKECLNKWKQKGREYFDCLKGMLENDEVKLDATQRESVAKSIEIYKKYTKNFNYKDSDAEFIMDSLKNLGKS